MQQYADIGRAVRKRPTTDLQDLSVGIVYGPMSEEDRIYIENAPRSEWSLTTLTAALDSLGARPRHLDPTEPEFVDRVQQCDVLLLNCHGPYGEDGRIQGLLDYLGVAYTSCGVLASAVGMDKVTSKAVCTALGLRTPRSLLVGDDVTMQLSGFEFPAMLKAADGGSSVGISLVHQAEDLDREIAVLKARGFERLFLEQFIHGRSITLSVLQTHAGPRALPALECKIDAPFYDERAKLGGAGAAEVEYGWPGDLPSETLAAMADSACAVFSFLQCRGAIRVDFMIDAENRPWVLEINTVPGLQRKSNLPMAAQLAGISYEDLVAHLVLEAVDRRESVRPAWITSVRAGAHV